MGLSPFILHLKNKQTETTVHTKNKQKNHTKKTKPHTRQNPAIGFSIQFQQVDTCHLNVYVLVSHQLVRERIEEIGREKKQKQKKKQEEEEEIISRI